MANFIGTAGNDSFVGSAAADTFDLFQGGDDTASGGGGADVFNMGGALNAADAIDGGGGADTLSLDGDYSLGLVFSATTLLNIEKLVVAAGHSYGLTSDDATVAAGANFTVDGSLLGAADVLTFDGSQELDGTFTLKGGGAADVLTAGAGDDAVSGGLGNDIIDLSHGGADSANGNGGNDTFVMGAALGATDTINGAAGVDVVQLAGNYGGGLVFTPTTMLGVETLQLGDGFNYDLTLDAATIAAGQVMTIDASALSGAKSLTLHGPVGGGGALNVLGGAGADAIYGSSGADTISGGGGNDFIEPGVGVDVVGGGSGQDLFQFLQGELTASDQIDGGPNGDILALTGDYSAGLTFAPTTMVNVETIQLAALNSFNLTLDDTNVSPGGTLTVDGSAIVAPNTLVFDGSAETDGVLALTGGAGGDTLIGGAQNDTLNGGAGADLLKGGAGANTLNGGDDNDTIDMNAFGGALTANSKIDGGNGVDLVMLGGDYSGGVTFNATTMVNVEALQLAGGHSYKLTTNDATVAAGQLLTVQAGALAAADVLTFDGSAETNGRFNVTTGSGNAALKGGAMGDGFTFNAVMAPTTTVDGKGGVDALYLNADYSGGFIFSATAMLSIETLGVVGGHSYTLTTNDANVAAGQTLSVDAFGLGAGEALNFNGAAETSGVFSFTGGSGNDVMTGGAGADTFNLTQGGVDTVNGGGGDDFIRAFGTLTASDALNGGLGNDRVELFGDYAAGLTFGASSLSSIEEIDFINSGHAAKLVMNDNNVILGHTLKVDGGGLGANALVFNGSADVSGGSFNLVGTSVNDVLTGGSSNDSFDLHWGGVDTVKGGGGADTFYFGAALTSADKIDGGAGSDTVSLAGNYDGFNAIDFAAGTMVNVEKLLLGNGGGYNLTMSDGNLATGQTLTVDGSALGQIASEHVQFDGSLETTGNFILIGGRNTDLMGGGGGTNVLTGGGGVDDLFAEPGKDTFVYPHVSDSTGRSFDTIFNFDVTTDRLDVLGSITGVNAKITSGALDVSNFDAQLAAAVNAAHLGAHHAVLFTPSSGSFHHNNNTFLIVDQNGIAGYQDGADLVIDMPDAQHHLGAFTAADFI